MFQALQTPLDNIPTSWYVLAMAHAATRPAPNASARDRLLAGALSLIRKQGYSSTTVDELCAEAGVTKGAFFHHFKSKDALAVAAARHWAQATDAFFATAPYHRHDDPLQRVLGYLDFRKSLLKGELAEYTCLVGTMLQEVYASRPDIRDACEASISGHASKVEEDIAAAIKLYGLRPGWSAQSLALHTQAVLQGAFILAKGKNDAAVAAASVDHLRRYVELLFESVKPAKNPRTKESS